MVPFGVVSINVRAVHVLRDFIPSVAVHADGSKTRISLFLEIVLWLAAGSVTLRVVDLVDVPIGTTGAAGESDGPRRVGIILAVVGESQLIESQILELPGALVFFPILFRRVIWLVRIVIVLVLGIPFLFGSC